MPWAALGFIVWDNMNDSVVDICLDCVDDVADVVVAHVGAGREAYAAPEQALAHAVDICGRVAVYGLPVHGLPQRACLDVGFVESHAQSFHVVAWLAVGSGCGSLVYDAGGAADSPGYDVFVYIVLSFDAQGGVEQGGT